MKFILKLLERILESISGLYTSDQVDNLAEAKVDSESFNTSLSAESEARISADEDLSNQIASAVSNQQALENVAEWQGYANAVQSMVDDEMAIMIAEEFEKATVEYLKDPTVTKDWSRTSIEVNNNPYAESMPSVLVDFSKINAEGYQNTYRRYPSFGENNDIVAFLPNAVTLKNAFTISSKFVGKFTLFVGENVNLYSTFGSTEGSYGDSVEVRISGKKDVGNLLILPSKSIVFRSIDAEIIKNLMGGSNLYWTVGNFANTAITLCCPNVVNASYATALRSNFTYLGISGGLRRATNMDCFALAIKTSTSEFANLKSIDFIDCEPCFDACETANRAFENRRGFDQFIAFPSLHTGNDMFLNAGMSAANISAVLDSLPSDPVGKGGTGVIKFTGCPGASELTQDSPSVSAAVARGWIVEL